MPAPDRGTPTRLESNPVRFARGIQGVYTDEEVDALLDAIPGGPDGNPVIPWVEAVEDIPAGLPVGTAYIVGPKPGPYQLFVEYEGEERETTELLAQFVGGAPGQVWTKTGPADADMGWRDVPAPTLPATITLSRSADFSSSFDSYKVPGLEEPRGAVDGVNVGALLGRVIRWDGNAPKGMLMRVTSDTTGDESPLSPYTLTEPGSLLVGAGDWVLTLTAAGEAEFTVDPARGGISSFITGGEAGPGITHLGGSEYSLWGLPRGHYRITGRVGEDGSAYWGTHRLSGKELLHSVRGATKFVDQFVLLDHESAETIFVTGTSDIQFVRQDASSPKPFYTMGVRHWVTPGGAPFPFHYTDIPTSGLVDGSPAKIDASLVLAASPADGEDVPAWGWQCTSGVQSGGVSGRVFETWARLNGRNYGTSGRLVGQAGEHFVPPWPVRPFPDMKPADGASNVLTWHTNTLAGNPSYSWATLCRGLVLRMVGDWWGIDKAAANPALSTGE